MFSQVAVKFLASADSAVIVEFGDRADRAISDQVLALAARIEGLQIEGVVELVPTFRSLMVHYDPLRTSAQDLVAVVKQALTSKSAPDRKRRLWRVPICYERDFAPDLESVARSTQLSTEEVIRLHAGTRYHVYMVGFVPGFPYMGDLAQALVLPRRADPRIHVPPGSVSIATTLTAIYPLDSPGGWHLIGTTPIRMFDVHDEPPALFAPGDAVDFEAIDAASFARIKSASERREYRPASTELAA
jgi:KipI family sensor histidine kinase inhibitor